MIQDMPFDSFDIQQHDEDGHYHNAYIDFMQSNGSFDTSAYESFIKKDKEKKVKKNEKPSLNEFIIEDVKETDDIKDNE
jgi:hypothetical protein